MILNNPRLFLLIPGRSVFQQHNRCHQKTRQLQPKPNRRTFSSSSRDFQQKNNEHIIPKAFCIGSLAGICGSLAGMGGGFIMIPLMTSSRLLGLSQHQAHGTSLFAVAATGIAGALGYQGQVQYDAAAAIATAGMVTAGLGASATARLSGVHLKKSLGVFMLLVAPTVPLKAYLVQQDEKKTAAATATATSDTLERTWAQRLVPPAIIGCGSGFLAGLFGVGGGAVVVPALTLCTDMNHYQALGTSLCAMVFPAISGTMTHFQKGNVAMRVAPALAVGAFCGGYLGGRLGLHINENALRWSFSGVMITLGLRSLI